MDRIVTYGDWVQSRIAANGGRPLEAPRFSVYSCQCQKCNRWWVQTQIRREPCPFCGSKDTSTHLSKS
jgi:hypothetical protein